MFEDPADLSKSKILYKGISVVRRDFCSFTKKTIEDAMFYVFMERNIRKAYDHVQTCVKDLMEGRVPNELLVMSKTLSSKHAEMKDSLNSTLPHVALYAKLKQRDPNNCPRSGERIEFLYTITGHKLLRDKVESPEYVRENCLELDLMYYFENQLHNPIEELFSLLLAPEPFEALGKSKTAVSLWKKFHQVQKYRGYHQVNKRSGQKEMTDFFGFSKKVKSNMLEEQKTNMNDVQSGRSNSSKTSSVLDNMPSVLFSKNL